MKNKLIASHSETTELPYGTKLKVTVENYEKPLFPMGPQILAGCKVDYASKEIRGTRWVGNYFETHYSEEEMKKEAEFIISKIKENPSNYKHEYAPK
jgi:hypothetical protein